MIGSTRGKAGPMTTQRCLHKVVLCRDRITKLIVTAWRICRTGNCGDGVLDVPSILAWVVCDDAVMGVVDV